jgi:hypothetical protein
MEASSTRLAVLTVCVEEPVSGGKEHWHCCQSARAKILKVTFKLIPSLHRCCGQRTKSRFGPEIEQLGAFCQLANSRGLGLSEYSQRFRQILAGGRAQTSLTAWPRARGVVAR